MELRCVEPIVDEVLFNTNLLWDCGTTDRWSNNEIAEFRDYMGGSYGAAAE